MSVRRHKEIVPRPVGLLGRLPSQFPGPLYDLTYYVAGSLPKAPPSVVSPKVADWGMLANDTVGDCGVASAEHVFMADASITHLTEPEAGAEQAKDYYFKYTGGQDSGVVLSQYLAYVRKNGYYGHTLHAYAPVKVSDIPTLQSVVNLYGAAYTGITVTAAMQQAFSMHRPWTLAVCSGQIIGGHAVPIVGYTDEYLTIVTWGGLQNITYSAWHHIASESWALITGEFVTANGDGRGVALDVLNADLDKLNA